MTWKSGGHLKGGYVGRILRVDLTSGRITEDELDTWLAANYVGGRGLGDRILYDELKATVDPLSPSNVLVFTTGALTGTKAPFSSRSWIVTKSPLSGTILMSNSGGFFGPELKFAGYDGIIVTGKANSPSYLWIRDGEVEIRCALHLWGLPTRETERRTREETDARARVACIGPSGEKLVRFTCVICDNRAFGRGGGGAVMASKNLKAVAVRGTGKVKIADEKVFNKIVKQVLDTYQKHEFIKEWRQFGTPYIVGPMNELGIFSTRNFQTGFFENHENINAEAHRKYVVKHTTCFGCPVTCTSLSLVEEGEYAGSACRGPEYQTLFSFGSQCGNNNLEAIIAASMLCNDLGMDTISTGNVVGFAMELYERGILKDKDTQGLELKFGSHESMVKLVKMIGNREGLGNILAEGVMRSSKEIGKGSEKYAMHVKGLELSGYDPRGAKSQGLAYATSPRGGCHHTGYAVQELYDMTFDRFTIKGKGKITKDNEDLTALIDSTGLCAFVQQLGVITTDLVAKLLYAATGLSEFRSVDNLLKAGERIINLERMFNVREGFTRRDDTLPERLLKEPMPTGSSKGQVVELGPMLDEYYAVRGWTRDGIPTKEKLKELKLRELTRA